MARTLDEYDFNHRKSDRVYPWTEWVNGRIWEIEQGEDFHGTTKNFAQRLYKEARKRAMKVQVSTPEENRLVFRFREPTEEDRLREEQDAAARERASTA